MPTKLLLCDRGGELAPLQIRLLKSGMDLEVEAATDVSRALDLATRFEPALVVTEIDLEGLPGSELIRRFRRAGSDTRVVCWTSIATPDTVAEMLAAGASAYLLKEDGAAAVVRAVRAVLDGNIAISPQLAGEVAGRLAAAERDQREAQRELARVTERLESLTTAKAEFLANVSHELRTPVTVAKGIAHVLKNRRVPEPERVEFLDKLESSLQKLTSLVNDMLTIADLDRGALDLNLRQIDLCPLLREIADEIGGRYPEIMLEQMIPPVLQAVADPARISEVIRHVVDNACRYSPAGEVVQVRARIMEEGVVVSVTDRGLGIQRQVVAQAFNEPFSTGEETLRKERAGAGLGLHLARQLVLQHGGIIWADPLPGGGSRVSFCIPTDRGRKVTERPSLPAEPIPQPASTGTSS